MLFADEPVAPVVNAYFDEICRLLHTDAELIIAHEHDAATTRVVRFLESRV